MLSRLKRLRLPPKSVVLVGFSGGGDSLALAGSLSRVHALCGLTLSLVHVDHGLRPESGADADRCRQLANQLGVPYREVKLSSDSLASHEGVGVEEAARRERYLTLAAAAADVGARTIAVAHHQDDQAETVLLHLLRGAGLQGACGMAELTHETVPWWTPKDDHVAMTFQLWRPLLTEPRTVLRDYVDHLGLTPVEDPTNAERQFRRNALRLDILPALESISTGAGAALARYASIVSEDEAFLAELANRALDDALTEHGTLRRSVLKSEAKPIQRRVAIAWLERLGSPVELTFERADAIVDLLGKRGSGQILELGANWVAIVDGDVIKAGPVSEVVCERPPTVVGGKASG